MKKLLILFTALIFCVNLTAQKHSVSKIEPPNWWAGMKGKNLQLMVYGSDLINSTVSVNSDEILIKKIHNAESPNYLFVDIELKSGLKPGRYTFTFTKNGENVKFDYEIAKREVFEGRLAGFSNKDVIYLITPDRFVNGDPSNDSLPGYVDPEGHSRSVSRARHGGDIQGMISKLDYIKELGFTAIWPSPVVENKTWLSYHGYSATDFYKVDPRFGSNELYKKLVDEAHERGLKVILDHVANHISEDHPWMKDLPFENWINGKKGNHLPATHHKMALLDINGDPSVYDAVTRGWFTDWMPDLNQQNPYLANYIIYNTIWWVEYAGLDGIREDTYPYADQEFMARWAKEIMEEFPTTNIVGEVWTGVAPFLAWHQKGNKLRKIYDSNLPAVTDFALRDLYTMYLQGSRTLYNIYSGFAEDYIYPDPDNLVTFVDNHDVGRAMYYAKEDVDKVKQVFTILLTTRGIPQIYYGSEIGMVGNEDHGILRQPFPGGWPGDPKDAFTESGRDARQNEMYHFFKKMINIRRSHEALQSGKMYQFPPQEGIYTYFRENGKETVMVILNEKDQPAEVAVNRYMHRFGGSEKGTDLFNGSAVTLGKNDKISLSAKGFRVIKIER
ncbi:MAG: cyclomaltodextrinase N-terminal domain-containing protein [Ignavibacteriaceae bacterium]|nr:cyclomaltodextrinase N-terminal domain-containing protein [Ignavibacteriaceae bacterium]